MSRSLSGESRAMSSSLSVALGAELDNGGVQVTHAVTFVRDPCQEVSDPAELSGPEVVEHLQEFAAGVHDEGTVPGDGLPHRQVAENHLPDGLVAPPGWIR